MKIIILILFLALSSFSSAFECPEKYAEKLDSVATRELYKKIAYYAYLHRKKREYIAASYEILSKIRTVGGDTMIGVSSTIRSTSNVQLLQMGVLEANILSISNKVNLGLLESILYTDIKKEIHEQFSSKNQGR
jgi:hypothetical protein